MSALDHASRRGTVTVEGSMATLRFERRLRHPIEAVWEALTGPDHLARWLMTQAVIDGRPGGSIDFVSGGAHVHATGRILAWDPPRLFEHERHIEPREGMPLRDDSVLRWELTAIGSNETLLTLTHTRIAREMAVGVTPATHALLDRLEAQLDGADLPELRARMGEVAAIYRR